MPKVIVAGGAGFIGSNLCRLLLEKGNTVVCVDNLLTGDESNISDFKKNTNFSFIKHDLTQPIDIPEVSHIYHLASPASPNKNSPRSYINYPTETLLVNSVGTYNLLELSRKNNARFLYASTSEVYGDPEVSPQMESYVGHVNPVGVRSVYDEGKRFGEAITMSYFRKHQVKITISRIFNTYGPYMQPDDGRVVSNFIQQALKNESLTIFGDGSQTRSFCYISDMVDGLEKAMLAQNTIGEVVNIGNPDERTIQELATIIKRAVGSESEIIYEELPEDDPKKRQPDISKAKKLIGWEPTVTLEEGLKKTINYFQSL